ncbi:acyl-CoA thioesterase [Noviherbaspirillum soli]|uniref:acyl-CoA thioesterase n=1 Tax=Noviherbaspirillum soli TaxID=1064518 RepID=UPI00188C5C14|nr:thioesterase family protein [Noviherbaspirillum soli]
MADRTLVHVTRMPIRWGDMDMMGHVNNAKYFTYIETARIDWFTSIACAPNPQGEGPVLINASCTFLRQLEYPGQIEIRTFVGAFGRTSFETFHEIRRVDQPDVLAAEGAAKVVWVDFTAGKSTPISTELRAILSRPLQAQ